MEKDGPFLEVAGPLGGGGAGDVGLEEPGESLYPLFSGGGADQSSEGFEDFLGVIFVVGR